MKPPTDSVDTAEITAGQVRAARALLDWSQEELADRAGVTRRTIAGFENGEKVPHKSTVERIVVAFRQDGVRFINADGEIGVLRQL